MVIIRVCYTKVTDMRKTRNLTVMLKCTLLHNKTFPLHYFCQMVAEKRLENGTFIYAILRAVNMEKVSMAKQPHNSIVMIRSFLIFLTFSIEMSNTIVLYGNK